MRTAHVECPSGAAGDMWLGALVDAGASLEAIEDAVQRLGVGDVRITVGRVWRAGVAATSARVRPPQDTPTPATWNDLRDIVEAAGLPDPVRDHCHAVLRRLTEAIAEVDGVAPADVRFHEVGALDTLGDVVGTCTAVHDLGLERLTIGPVPTGADDPTVAVLLRGHQLVASGSSAELVTPTGAALIAELCRPVAEAPEAPPRRVGVGAGSRDLDHPNVLRVLLGGAL